MEATQQSWHKRFRVAVTGAMQSAALEIAFIGFILAPLMVCLMWWDSEQRFNALSAKMLTTMSLIRADQLQNERIREKDEAIQKLLQKDQAGVMTSIENSNKIDAILRQSITLLKHSRTNQTRITDLMNTAESASKQTQAQLSTLEEQHKTDVKATAENSAKVEQVNKATSSLDERFNVILDRQTIILDKLDTLDKEIQNHSKEMHDMEIRKKRKGS